MINTKNLKEKMPITIKQIGTQNKENLFLASLGFNKSQKKDQIKTLGMFESSLVSQGSNKFITENSVHYDKNVIIKENSKFLPNIKNIVKEYQKEKNYNFLEKSNILVKKNISNINENNTNLSSKEIYHKVEKSNLIKIKEGNLLNGNIIEHLYAPKVPMFQEEPSWSIKNILKKLYYKKKNLTVLKRNKNTTLYQYLYNISKNTPTKEGNGISITPKLNKKYGILLAMQYNKIINYSFLKNKPKTLVINNGAINKELALLDQQSQVQDGNRNWQVEELYKLLLFYFKSIYSLISKPVIYITPDKVKIQLFYYLTIPKKSIIRLFAIHYLKYFRNKWTWRASIYPMLALRNQRNNYKNKKLKKNYNNNYSYYLFKNRNNFFNNNQKVRLPYIKGKARKSISRIKSKDKIIRDTLVQLVRVSITKVFARKFKLICKILSNKFNKPVELELIRLHNPYLDSNILANLFQLIIKNKKRKPKKAVDKIYNKNQVKKLSDPNLASSEARLRGRTRNIKPAFLSGLNFYINGRLMGEPIVPRLTTKTFEKGATATGKVNFLDKSSITKKNKKGAYTIKVISAQNYF